MQFLKLYSYVGVSLSYIIPKKMACKQQIAWILGEWPYLFLLTLFIISIPLYDPCCLVIAEEREVYCQGFLGFLPAFRQDLKAVPKNCRMRLTAYLGYTFRKMVPYASTIFRTGVQRFMQHNIPRHLITKSAADLMLTLINAERKTRVKWICNTNTSFLCIVSLMAYNHDFLRHLNFQCAWLAKVLVIVFGLLSIPAKLFCRKCAMKSTISLCFT